MRTKLVHSGILESMNREVPQDGFGERDETVRRPGRLVVVPDDFGRELVGQRGLTMMLAHCPWSYRRRIKLAHSGCIESGSVPSSTATTTWT